VFFNKLWNFLRGYVRINISGFSVERLINQAAANGLIFVDMRRIGGIVAAKVSRHDLSRLIAIAEKTGTTITEESHVGLPTVVRRLKKRFALALGLIFFVGGLVFLTSFIWHIEVEGNTRIDSDEVTVFLAHNGLAVGTWRHGIGYREVEGMLMAHFSDIAWASVSITGTRAVVSLVETLPQPAVIDLSTPADIVAAKDGIILHMATGRGTPNVRPGDVVRVGDVLVSGVLAVGVEGEEISYHHVNAASEIWARVYYRMNFEIPLIFFEKSFTGSTQKVYSIMIADKNFTLPHRSHNFIYFETTKDHNRLSLGQNFPLPLGWQTENHYELTRHMRRRTAEEAWQIGQEIAQSRINDEIADSAEIISKEIKYTEINDAILIEVFLVSHERVDKSQEINIEFEIDDKTDEEVQNTETGGI